MVMKEMVVATSFGRVADLSTLYYIVEHDIAEVGKKNMDQRAYLVVVVAIDSTD